MSDKWPGDPLLDEVDEARRRILAECDSDPGKAMESYLEYQQQFADRLVNHEKGSAERKIRRLTRRFTRAER